MAINDFSSLIQLSATMSIAFVAVEYVKSYTSILCERVFKFHDFVKQSFRECREILTDKETLEHITPVNVGGKSTNSVIEEAKRKNESLTREIEKEENLKKEEVSAVCQARSMSSLCFFCFLFNILLLFLGGVESMCMQFTHIYSTIFCSFVLIYITIGWCIGENENPKKFCDFSSLRHVIISFITIVVLSAIFCSVVIYYNLFSDKILYFWQYLLIVSVLFSYLNFIVFVAKIGQKAKAFKENVKSSKNDLVAKCKNAKKDEDDLLATSRIEAKLRTD